MSLNKRFFSFLAVATVAAAFSTVSFAQEAKVEALKADTTTKTRPDGMGKGMHGGLFGRLGQRMHELRALALTDAQKQQLKAILEANKPDKAVFDELRTIHESRKAGTDLYGRAKTAARDPRSDACQGTDRSRSDTEHSDRRTKGRDRKARPK